MMPNATHEFAIYIHSFSLYHEKSGLGSWRIDDPLLVHRLNNVLRLKAGDTIILFNRSQHGVFTIHSYEKSRYVIGTISALQDNVSYQPKVTFWLPMLKKEALETAIYNVVETGVTTIQLIKTEKSSTKPWTTHEAERINRIMIAAAEQAKYFAFPELYPPTSLDQALSNIPKDTMMLFAHPSGKSTSQIVKILEEKKPQHIILCIGPEADLTPSEQEAFRTKNALSWALTPTILRAPQAAALCVGITRSLLQ